LITATVEAILAQRLVRRICSQCREPTKPSEEMLYELRATAEEVAGKNFYKGRGCDVCNNTGYKGRVGLFELMLLNDQLREMVMENSAADELRKVATGSGMIPLRDYGMEFVYEGVTTLDEVMRETVLDA